MLLAAGGEIESEEAMSILNYLKPQNGLPDPNSPFSLHLPSQAITLANREVAKVTKESTMKRDQYKREVSLKQNLSIL